MIRGEKPIELGDSWFSAKSIEVERTIKIKKGQSTRWVKVAQSFTDPKETPNTFLIIVQTDFER